MNITENKIILLKANCNKLSKSINYLSNKSNKTLKKI